MTPEAHGNDVSPDDILALTNRFIDLANALAREAGSSRVTVALAQAAARHNAFQAAAAGAPQELAGAIHEHFCARYATFLATHMAQQGLPLPAAVPTADGGACAGTGAQPAAGPCGTGCGCH